MINDQIKGDCKLWWTVQKYHHLPTITKLIKPKHKHKTQWHTTGTNAAAKAS